MLMVASVNPIGTRPMAARLKNLKTVAAVVSTPWDSLRCKAIAAHVWRFLRSLRIVSRCAHSRL